LALKINYSGDWVGITEKIGYFSGGNAPLLLWNSYVNFGKRDDKIRHVWVAGNNGGGIHFSECADCCPGYRQFPEEKISG